MEKKTLILLAKAPDGRAAQQARSGEVPRIEYLELARALGAEVADFHTVGASTHPLVQWARRRGPLWGLAALGAVRRHAVDQFYVTGEDIGMPLAMMLHAVRDLGRVTMVVHHGGAPRRRKVLHALGHAVWRNVIVLASRQVEILTEEMGYPRHKVHRLDQWLDADFYAPQEATTSPGEYVFSCGRESRDYPTLQRAAASSPTVPFRVVASGWAAHAGFDAATNITSSPNLTVESGLSYRDLRSAYERARFVVVPIDRVDYAAGVTGICEAMSMGKAVIATDSPGIRDYIAHGVSGLVVPVGDHEALRRAVVELWNAPERARAMGAHNRRWIVEHMSVDRYVARVAGLFGVLPLGPSH